MPVLSSAAWIAHDLSLATSIGGALFGKAALRPSLDEVTDPIERQEVANRAWRRFNAINIGAHAIVAISWLAGRAFLSGGEAGRSARSMTRAKDVFIVTSLLTGIAAALVRRRIIQQSDPSRTLAAGPTESSVRSPELPGESSLGEGSMPSDMTSGDDGGDGVEASAKLERTARTLGTLNLVSNVGVAALTAALAMKGSESHRFSRVSKDLP